MAEKTFPKTKLRIRTDKKAEKKLLSTRIDSRLLKDTKILAIELDRRIESLIEEALTNLIADYKKSKKSDK